MASLAGLLLVTTPITAWSQNGQADSLDTLLEQVRTRTLEDTAELKRREAEFAANRDRQAEHLSDANNVRLQLGTALFNAGEFKAAEQVFVQVRASGEEREVTTAENWLKFARAEMKRKQAISSS